MPKIQTNNSKHQHKRQQGFTLLELLLVISLLGIISTIAIVSYENVQDESMIDVTKYEMQELKKALLQFRVDNRAFPCGVYNLDKRPYELDVDETASNKNMVYAGLPAATAPLSQRQAWCEGNGSAENNALQMLLKFPFDIGNADIYIGTRQILHPLWNHDVKRGWRGPYISSAEGIKDAWGKYYRLIDPELDFPAYESDKRWCGLDVTDSFYDCQVNNDINHIKSGNSARIVSMGPNGIYGGPNTTNPDAVNPEQCLPNLNDDDLVLCLLK